jgi:Cdc6-like AAA superfamily ATPase
MTLSGTNRLSSTTQRITHRLESDSTEQLVNVLNDPEFTVYEDYRETLTAEFSNRYKVLLRDFSGEIGELLTAEDNEQAARSKISRRSRWLNAGLIAFSLPIAYEIAASLLRYHGRDKFLFAAPAFNSAFDVALFIAGMVTAIGILLAFRMTVQAGPIQEHAVLKDELQSRQRVYNSRLRIAVAQQLRLLISELDIRDVGLELAEAPDMVELALAEIVPTDQLRAIESFVRTHTSSALGIAGPRGAGKTSILRHLTSFGERSVCAYMPAPVRYESDELLLRIFELLASEYLGKNWRIKRASRRRANQLFATCLASLTIGGALLALGVTHSYSKVNIFDWIGGVLLALAFSLYPIALRTLFRNSAARTDKGGGKAKSRPDRAAIVRQADKTLEGLRWQRQKSVTDSIGVNPRAGWLNAGRQKSISLIERDIGRPRLVGDFQDFVRGIVSDPSIDRVIIAVDELDKLPSAEDAIAVITELKDILHIEGAHVLVSVSEDVMEKFALRGMPRRDVFDSSFDDIIEIADLTLNEAVDILQKRAARFPVEWAYLCYALSGGLPRDLLRYARRCIDIYREQGGSAEPNVRIVGPLVGESARERAITGLRTNGILSRLSTRGQDELSAALKKTECGDLGPLADFVESVSDSYSSLVRWLRWAEEVVARLSYTDQGNRRDAAIELARRVAALGRP